MPARAQILQTINQAYEARMRGDKAALATFLAPGATFRLAGETSMLASVPAGTSDLHQAAAALIDLFQFHDLKQLGALVDDGTAVIHWQASVSTGGQEPVTTELCDLWTFDEQGRLKSLVQFVDTALLVQMLA